MSTVSKRSSSASTSRFRSIETEWKIDPQSFEVHLAVPEIHLAAPKAHLAVLETHPAVPEADLSEQGNTEEDTGEMLKYSEHVYTISEEDLKLSTGSQGGY